TIIATVGSIIVIVMTLREWRATGGGIGRSAAALHDIPCTLCRRSMHIQRADLKPLTGVEVGLVVQAIPEASGRTLAEVYCPHCQALHTFAVDRRPPEWIGVNLSAPEQKAPVCLEC